MSELIVSVHALFDDAEACTYMATGLALAADNAREDANSHFSSRSKNPAGT